MPAKGTSRTTGSAQKRSPPKSATTRGIKGGTGKKAKEKQKKSKLNLKGWLETKADWAKFDAWAEINAQPRKIPEPEPVVRATKPLSQMKKRILVLSKPHKQPDISKTCRTDLRVSKKALTAKPSKRIIKLAMFVMKNIDPGREFPMKISRSALSYKASKRIIEISQPQLLYLSDFCKFLVKSQNVTPNEETNDRAKRSALAKKLVQCPDLMTDEEMNIVKTPTGVFRSALNYKVTPWMNYLALPSYRFLKDRTDEKAEEWKKIIVTEGESRGKKSLEYKKKKRREAEKARKPEKDENKIEEMKEDDVKTDGEEQPIAVAAQDDGGNDVEKQDKSPEEEYEAQANETNQPADETGDTEQDSTINEKKRDKEPSKVTQKAEVDEFKSKEETAEEEMAVERRKAERNAWRFEPSPCADNPFEIKRAALTGKVSPRMDELAKHREHKDRLCRKNPFEVRKSALDGPVPERMAELAKPSHPLDPVERPPPREKDSFGRPIFEIPPYGKKMPRIKPYQEAECPEKEEKVDDEGAKKKNKGSKRKAIDPIVFEPTIDPCIDPDRAKRQLKARKAAKQEIAKNKEGNETSTNNKKADEADAKENEPQAELDTDD